MKHDKVKEYKAWFTSGSTLEEIGKQLTKNGIISNFDYDYENIYEWFVAKTEDKDLELNISRKHCNGENYEDEPIHILAMYTNKEPENTIIEHIATEIANLLHCKVNLGFLQYLQDDEYEYRAISEKHS